MMKKDVRLTRAEIDSLTEYAEKVRAELISSIFTDVEELLQGAIKSEGIKADFKPNTGTHHYAKRLCQMLVADLRKIERKYKE